TRRFGHFGAGPRDGEPARAREAGRQERDGGARRLRRPQRIGGEAGRERQRGCDLLSSGRGVAALRQEYGLRQDECVDGVPERIRQLTLQAIYEVGGGGLVASAIPCAPACWATSRMLTASPSSTARSPRRTTIFSREFWSAAVSTRCRSSRRTDALFTAIWASGLTS